MPAVTVINTLPHFVTPQEHADIVSRTPETFSDIPPVLRQKRENVTIIFDPPIPEFTDDNKGTLYVVESLLIFMTPSRGFQVKYPKITLHAVSRSETGPYIYCQLDEQADGAELAEDEDSEMSELKIFPGDIAAVEAIFEALSLCASLHPDPNVSGNELDEDAGDAFLDADGEEGFQVFTGGSEEELSEVGRAALEHLESIIQPRQPAPIADTDHQSPEPKTDDDQNDTPKVNGTH